MAIRMLSGLMAEVGTRSRPGDEETRVTLRLFDDWEETREYIAHMTAGQAKLLAQALVDAATKAQMVAMAKATGGETVLDAPSVDGEGAAPRQGGWYLVDWGRVIEGDTGSAAVWLGYDPTRNASVWHWRVWGDDRPDEWGAHPDRYIAMAQAELTLRNPS